MFEIVEMCSIASAIDPCNDFFVIQAQGSWKCGQQRRRNEEKFQWCQETELLRNGIDSEEEVDSPECIQDRCIFHCLLLVQRCVWQNCDAMSEVHLHVSICFISLLYAMSADISRASQSVHFHVDVSILDEAVTHQGCASTYL